MASLPAGEKLPANYEKAFPDLGIIRIRRQETSASTMLSGNSRFFSLRHGDAVINAVRFASAFFGKGQFIREQGRKEGSAQVLTQSLRAPYYQPVDHVVKSAGWNAVHAERKQSQVCNLEQKATIAETSKGFRLRLQSAGTGDVPIAVEINFREGGQIEGCVKSKIATDSWVLPRVLWRDRRCVRFGQVLRHCTGRHLPPANTMLRSFTAVSSKLPLDPGSRIENSGFQTVRNRKSAISCIRIRSCGRTA
jgi:hypothetical protein